MSLDGDTLIRAYKKRPVLATCAIIGVVCLLTLYFRMDNLPRAEVKMQEAGKERELMQTQAGLLAEVKGALSKLQSANVSFQSHMIAPTALAQNLQYFYKLEADTGVTLTDLRQQTVDKSAAGQSFVAVPFTVGVKGSYEQVMQFLRKVEKGPYLTRITGGGLTPVAAGENQGPTDIVAMSLNLELMGKL